MPWLVMKFKKSIFKNTEIPMDVQLYECSIRVHMTALIEYVGFKTKYKENSYIFSLR